MLKIEKFKEYQIVMYKNKDGQTIKQLISKDYNYHFNLSTGYFARWGRTEQDDPIYSKFGPEILDLEISDGECSGRCKFCYKQNGNNNGIVNNMSFETFKTILDKMPKTLTQVAFGICDIISNAEMWKMFEYARSQNVIPNYTCNGNFVTDEIARRTSELCGAVAVSIVNKENSYDAIKKFTDVGMTQVNIHSLLSEQTFDKCMHIVDDMKNDPRLSKMNAIVFLQYKHKNPNSPFTSMLDKTKYRMLVDHCQKNKVNFGFDSCSCNLFIDSMEGHKDLEQFKLVGEPCEACMYSSYINVNGEYSPCSFCENVPSGWETGLDVVNCQDFVKDIWFHPKTVAFREKLINNKRNCPIYEI